MRVIATYTKPEEAYLAASLLEGNGIEAEVQDAETVSMYWMYSQAIGGVKVLVADEDLHQAWEVLNLPAYGEPSLVCPYCGSSQVKMRELNLFTAISIGLGFLLPIRTRTVDCMDCEESFSYKSEPARTRD